MANLDVFLDTLRRAVDEVRKHPGMFAKGPHSMMEEAVSLPQSICEKAARLCFHELSRLDNFASSK